MKTIYSVVSKETQAYLSEPSFNRDIARATLQSIKQQGVSDAIILASKINTNTSQRIR